MRTIMLRGIRDECLEVLNLMGSGDVSQYHMMRYVIYADDIQEGTPRLVEAPEMPLPGSQNLLQEQGSQRMKLVTCLKILKLIFSSL
jgi:hypothetical protein